MIQMADTAVLMLSKDYKVRFVAEYWQVKNRYDRLREMCTKYEAGTLEFRANCPLEVLKQQMNAMYRYCYYLEVRARIEKVDLNQPAETYGNGENAAPETSTTKPMKVCMLTVREFNDCMACGCED